jgi:prepilin-type processing-associated H-X9-DG protein/prepilin-type N-terminal cleavage/methylation domain-containing protein
MSLGLVGKRRLFMTRRSKQDAFTLVELLIVVGIIAILVGILLPVMSRAHVQAQLIQCESNMRQWGIGIQSYCASNFSVLPLKGPDGDNYVGPGQTAQSQWFQPPNCIGYDDPTLWFNAIPACISSPSYYQQLVDNYQDPGLHPLPEYGQNNMFVCPSSVPALGVLGIDTIDPVDNNFYDLFGIDSNSVIRSGLHPAKFFKFDFSYVWNSKMASPSNGNSVLALKMNDIHAASDVPLMVEKISSRLEYKYDAGVQAWVNTPNGQSIYGPGGNAQQPGGMIITSEGFTHSNVQQAKSDWTRFAVCHNGGSNILFADGHVAWYKWSQVQFDQSQLPWPNEHINNGNGPNGNINEAGIQWCAIGPCQ